MRSKTGKFVEHTEHKLLLSFVIYIYNVTGSPNERTASSRDKNIYLLDETELDVEITLSRSRDQERSFFQSFLKKETKRELYPCGDA